jgi:CO/xanthine dehydrogenase FAD-binding subunit
MATALQPDELIVELRLPPWPRQRRWAFEEFSRQRGAFALAAIALFYDEENARAINAHIGVIGASSGVHRLHMAEETLNGHVIDRDTINAVANAAAAEVDPVDDAEAGAAYRRALVATLVTTALERASTRHETQSE